MIRNNKKFMYIHTYEYLNIVWSVFTYMNMSIWESFSTSYLYYKE